MKRLVGVLSLLAFSASAFAFTDHSGDWKGSGYWKANDGTKGKWVAKSTVTHGKDGVTVKEKTKVFMPDGKELVMEEEFTMKFTGNGFSTISKAGKDEGTGYCGMKQCHIQTTDHEETVTFHEGKMYRLGSHTEKDHTVMYQGWMKPAKKAKKRHHGDVK